MKVKELIKWLKDKPEDSIIIKGIPGRGFDKHEELNFTEIGLIHAGKNRVDPNGEQGELF